MLKFHAPAVAVTMVMPLPFDNVMLAAVASGSLRRILTAVNAEVLRVSVKLVAGRVSP
jgi:hypothetical protein